MGACDEAPHETGPRRPAVGGRADRRGPRGGGRGGRGGGARPVPPPTGRALPALLSASARPVAAWGGAGGGAGNMDHGGMGKDGGGEGGKNTVMEGTEHSKVEGGSGGMASGMLMEDGRYSDERFIDAMVPHHRGAGGRPAGALGKAQPE